MNKYRIGIDVGATNIKVGLFDGEMNMIDHIQTLIDQDADLNRLMDYIAALAKRIAKDNNIEVRDLLGVGAAFPCYIDYKNGIALDACNVMALSNAPVRDMLCERLGVPVIVDNDANAAALGEHRMGAGVGHEHMIYAALATGIGGGLIINGKLYRGMHGMAGEIGHMFISDSTGYPCSCGVTGCVDLRISSRQILR